MKVITGDEFGFIKECIIPARKYVPSNNNMKYMKKKKDSEKDDEDKNQTKVTIINRSSSISSRSKGVVALSQLSPSSSDKNQYSIAALLLDGSVHTYQGIEQQEATTSLHDIFGGKEGKKWETSDSSPIAMESLASSSKDEEYLVACDSLGHVSMLKRKSHEEQPFKVVTNYPDIVLDTTGTNNVTAFCTSSASSSSACALGGRNQNINVICLETGTSIWKSKNVKPSLKTLLEEPIWTTALKFNSNGKDNLLIAGTAYKKICLYDIRSQQQRRPILVSPVSLLNYRVTSLLTTESNNNTVIIGDASGGIHSFDLRKMNSILHRYVGPVGSVRSMSSSKNNNDQNMLFSCVGLDRYLRIFDIRKPRKSLEDVYLKQRLNCCITLDCDEENDDDEDFFNFVDRQEQDYRTKSGNNVEADEEDRVEDYNYIKKNKYPNLHDNEQEFGEHLSSSASSANEDDGASLNSTTDDSDDNHSTSILDGGDEGSSNDDFISDSDDDGGSEEEDYEDPFTHAAKSSSKRAAMNYAVKKRRKV